MKNTTYSAIAFVTGLFSVFLWQLSIIPVLAIIFGTITATKIKTETNPLTRSVMIADSIIGITLGVIFLLVRILK